MSNDSEARYTLAEAALISLVEKVARNAHGWTKHGATEDEVVRIARLAVKGALDKVPA